MTKFQRYPHLERYPHQEVAGIEIGKVWVFPKLDGTNASVWIDAAGQIQCGSRNRVLTTDNDNAGFCAWVLSDDRAAPLRRKLVDLGPRYAIFGEWLVPHSVKGYRDDAWRRFWIFDVWDRGAEKFVPHEVYSTWLDGCDVLPPLCSFNDPSPDQLRRQVQANTFLMAEGAGIGEGVVVKNYEWANNDGRQTWAKFVAANFAKLNAKEFGAQEKQGEVQVEAVIADLCVTAELVAKERAKIVAAMADEHGCKLTTETIPIIENTYRGKLIPALLGKVYHCVVTEELWQMLKKFKNPAVDFSRLNLMVINRTKRHAADLFGVVV